METIRSSSASQPDYPLLGDRIQSTFIDTLLIIVLMIVSGSILDRYEDVPTWIRVALFVGLWVVYEPLCTTLGATLGNYIKNIRVRQVGSSSKKINIFQALVRYVLKLSLGWMSFLTINANKERRAIHDLAVGSVMIKI